MSIDILVKIIIVFFTLSCVEKWRFGAIFTN